MHNKANTRKALIKYLLYLNDKKYFKIKKRILKKLGYILKEKPKLKREDSMDRLLKRRGKSKEKIEEVKEEKPKLTPEEARFLNSEESDKIVFEMLHKW